MSSEIMNKIKTIIKEVSESEAIYSLNLNEDFIQSLQLDSMSFIKIVVKLESEFNISIDDEDLSFENLNTIEKLQDYITTEQK